jgi:selenocysteine-specific elongation factor
MTQQSSSDRYFTLATAGHVDHGKTSLLRALTGIDPDRLKEEKERGMTIDLGFAHLKLPDGMVLGFIDVPGHGKFLKNMLAGVGGIEYSLLVVSADEGPMPQTYEHVRILGLLGIRAAIIAITKADLVDSELVEMVEQQVRELLDKEGIEVLGAVAVSCIAGTGIDELKKLLSDKLSQLPDRTKEGAAFLPVDRVFSKTGFGKVITGTLVRGSLTVGDQVLIEPGGLSARVRRLETFGQSLERAYAGQRLACNLVVKDDAAISRGHAVLGEQLAPTSLLAVHFVGLPERFGAAEIAELSGQPLRLYHGTAECHGRIRWVEPIEQAHYDWRGGPEALACFGLSNPVVAEAQDRFVIRLSDDTIYGGTVVVREQPRWLTREKLKETARLLLLKDYKAAVISYVQSCPQRMVNVAHLDKLLPTTLRHKTLESLIDEKKLTKLGDFLLTVEFRAELQKKILAETTSYTDEKKKKLEAPLVPLEHLKTHVMPIADRVAFQELISAMEEARAIVRQGDKVTIPGREIVSTSPEQEALCIEIERVLAVNLCLEINEIVKISGRQLREVKAALDTLVRGSRAAVVDYEYASSAASLKRAHQLLGKLWKERKQITPSEFKEGLGTSRKYAMALLAYFDDRKITRRLQEGRALLVNPPD